MRQTSEKVFSGIGVSHGIAIGDAYVVQVEHPRIQIFSIDDVAAECARLNTAIAQAKQDILEIRENLSARREESSEEIILLLDAHLAMLSGSRLVRGAVKRIEDGKINAEAAIEAEVRHLADQFRRLQDTYISARIDDIEAVGNRLLRLLMGVPYLTLSAVPPSGIVLARDISPSDMAQMDPAVFGGLATVHGGAAGHTAVIARSFGLPAVLGIPEEALEEAGSRCRIIIDGIGGMVILHPRPDTEKKYAQKLADIKEDASQLARLVSQRAVTSDGIDIVLRANLELPREMPAILSSGAQGIGLFRTEFLFMNRPDLPGEQEQFDAMAEVVHKAKGESVTFRTLDIGGDKLAASLGRYIAEAQNPALGLRAIRLSLKEPHILKTQFRAILRVGALGPVRILLPMVTTAREVNQARDILEAAFDELKKEGVNMAADLPPVGTMIEIPAAALAADSLAAVSDFFALGTNDLVQYTVAIDRGNDQVASLYDPLNPAVLRLMKFSIDAGLRAGLRVSICGEMAADPLYTPLLLGMGLQEISVGPASLPRIKRRIRNLSMADCKAHTLQVLDQYDPEKIHHIVRSF